MSTREDEHLAAIAEAEVAEYNQQVSIPLFSAAPFLRFNIAAVPIATPRPRAVMKGPRRAGMAPPPRDHSIHDFMASCRKELKEHYSGPPLDQAIGMTIVFVLPRPKGKIWKTKPMPREWYTAHCNDWDNLGKGICDSWNKLLYADDGCLCDVHVQRLVASGYEQPHVEVTVNLLGAYS